MLIPNLGFGGAQRCFSKLSEELARHNKVVVCVFNDQEEVYYTLGGKLKYLDVSGGKNIVDKTKSFIRRVVFLKKIKKEENIDIAISYLEGANYVNILSKRREKVIISIRGSQLHDETIKGAFGYLRKKHFIPTLYRFANQLVALNKGIRDELTEAFNIKKEKCFVIPNFYNIEEIKELSQVSIDEELQSVIDNNSVISTTGRLAIEKGYTHLIEVFSAVIKRKKQTKLLIIGEGPLKEDLIKLAEKKGLKVYSSSNSSSLKGNYDIYFLGYQKNPFKYISRSDIFTITSSSEGGPNILSEAMICGTFTISVDCPTGPREKIAPGTKYSGGTVTPEFGLNGVLMPMLNKKDNKREVEIWADFIVENIENEPLKERYTKQASLYMEQFSVNEVMTKWIRVING